MDGSLLATASIGDTNVLIWNIDKLQNNPLRRVAPACCLLKWSPDGTLLFSSTVGNVFRVWNCDKKWTPERWTLNAATIKSACWSPCSSFLLFVTEEPVLYRLQFIEEQLFTSKFNNIYYMFTTILLTVIINIFIKEKCKLCFLILICNKLFKLNTTEKAFNR